MDIIISKDKLHKILSLLLNEGYLLNLYDSSDYQMLYIDSEHQIENFVNECFYEKKCTIHIGANKYIELEDDEDDIVISDIADADIKKMISHIIE